MADPHAYPVFLDLDQRPVLIVGGGGVGLRKAQGLAPTGAQLTVLSPTFAPEFAGLPHITRIPERYMAGIMQSQPRWALVFAATDIRPVNDAFQRDAAAAGILCCRCDEPELGDFAGGAVCRQGGVTIAVSTQGASPVLAARIRDAAAASLDPALVTWTELLGPWRDQILARVPDADVRRTLLRRIAGPEMEICLREERAASGGSARAQALFQSWLDEALRSGKDVHAS